MICDACKRPVPHSVPFYNRKVTISASALAALIEATECWLDGTDPPAIAYSMDDPAWELPLCEAKGALKKEMEAAQ
jgi:hypothetical protein